MKYVEKFREKINDFDVIGGMYKRGSKEDLNNIIEICKNKLLKAD